VNRFSILFVAWLIVLGIPFNSATPAEPVRGGTLVIGYRKNADRLDGHRIRSGGVYVAYDRHPLQRPGDRDDKHNVIPTWPLVEIRDGAGPGISSSTGVEIPRRVELTAEVVKWNFERAGTQGRSGGHRAISRTS